MLTPENPPDLRHPEPAPVQFGGQWVAWNKARTEIIAHGKDMANVHAQAIAVGHPNAILQRVRRPDISFIGSA